MLRNRAQLHGRRHRLADDDAFLHGHRRAGVAFDIGHHFGRRFGRVADDATDTGAYDGANRAANDSTKMPFENTSRSPRFESWRGRYPSRAMIDDRRGKSA